MKTYDEVAVHLSCTAGNDPETRSCPMAFECRPLIGEKVAIPKFMRVVLSDHLMQETHRSEADVLAGNNPREERYGLFLNDDGHIQVSEIVRVDEVIHDSAGKLHIFVLNV